MAGTQLALQPESLWEPALWPGVQEAPNWRGPLTLLALKLRVPLSPAQLQMEGSFYSSRRAQSQLLFHRANNAALFSWGSFRWSKRVWLLSPLLSPHLSSRMKSPSFRTGTFLRMFTLLNSSVKCCPNIDKLRQPKRKLHNPKQNGLSTHPPLRSLAGLSPQNSQLTAPVPGGGVAGAPAGLRAQIPDGPPPTVSLPRDSRLSKDAGGTVGGKPFLFGLHRDSVSVLKRTP